MADSCKKTWTSFFCAKSLQVNPSLSTEGPGNRSIDPNFRKLSDVRLKEWLGLLLVPFHISIDLSGFRENILRLESGGRAKKWGYIKRRKLAPLLFTSSILDITCLGTSQKDVSTFDRIICPRAFLDIETKTDMNGWVWVFHTSRSHWTLLISVSLQESYISDHIVKKKKRERWCSFTKEEAKAAKNSPNFFCLRFHARNQIIYRLYPVTLFNSFSLSLFSTIFPRS